MRCYILLVVACVLIAFIADLLNKANAFKTFKSGQDDCVRVHAEHAIGLEDGDRFETGAIFSADDRTGWFSASNRHEKLGNSNGHLLFVDSDHKISTLARKSDQHIKFFHPHGLSVLESSNSLFVVNHQTEFDEILVYSVDLNSMSLTLRESVRDNVLFRSLNDVVAVSDTEFYATVWEYYPTHTLLNALEVFGQFKWTYVVHCKKDKSWSCSKAATGFAGANGINLTADKRHLLVAEAVARTLHIFKIEPDGSLTREQSIDALGAIDNIHVEHDGMILATIHAQALNFLRHARNTTAKSPTIVAQLVGQVPRGDLHWRTLYEGDALSGGSIALPLGNRLLIGGVFERGLHACPLSTGDEE